MHVRELFLFVFFCFILQVNSNLVGLARTESGQSFVLSAPCRGFGTSGLLARPPFGVFFRWWGGGVVRGVVAERANTFECRAC